MTRCKKSIKVKIIAPSSPYPQDRYHVGVERLRALGFEIISEPCIRSGDFPYLNGSDDERLNELKEALLSNSHEVVWAARGGYGVTRLISLLNAKHLPSNIPTFIGFSDDSALHCYLWTTRQKKNIHGPVVTSLGAEPNEVCDALIALLESRAQSVNYPTLEPIYLPPKTPVTLEGTLIVSNLCMLTHLIGTKTMPNLAGANVLIEEIDEKPYRIDRMLTHLYAAGAFDGVKSVVMGRLVHCTDNKQTDPRLVITERMRAFNIPLFSAPFFGHEAPNWPFIFGAKCMIQTKKTATYLRLLEEL